MFQRILVPLDGSIRAQQALAVAARLALVGGGTVILLRVVNTQVVGRQSLSSPLPSAAMQTMLEVERENALRYLTSLAETQEMAQIQHKIVVQVGAVAPTIVQCAVEQKCDLLLLSRQGQGASLYWPLGSVAEKVLHANALPVLLLQNTITPHTTRALLALDGSANAEAALPLATQLLSQLDEQGTLTLLHILQEEPQDTQMHEYWVCDGQRYLSEVTERLRQQQGNQHYHISWKLLQGADVAKTLVNAFELEPATEDEEAGKKYNLLIMTTSGRGNAGQAMLGSIAERVLHTGNSALFMLDPHWQPEAMGQREHSLARSQNFLGEQKR